jgi:putative ABC transport system ATP-binding protein
LGLLAGLDRPTAGEVWLGDTALNPLSEDARAVLQQRSPRFVSRPSHAQPVSTALGKMMLPLELAGAADAAPRAREWLLASWLVARPPHYPRQLSEASNSASRRARSPTNRRT